MAEAVHVYPVGVSGGFIAGYDVELVFDRDHPGTGFDLVGAEARCRVADCEWHSGYRGGGPELWRALRDHVRAHQPAATVHGEVPSGPATVTDPPRRPITAP